jgi:succinoglycan biosynthesis protein ExoM
MVAQSRECGKAHISICVCTYKRPNLLSRLVETLLDQVTDCSFDYSIVVVDNDWAESARDCVAEIARASDIRIDYDMEPEQNIALARNRAVRNARGELIAFIDDDEFPALDWLLKLYQALKKYRADGVLGPVIAHFDEEPPRWVRRGKFFDREVIETGRVLDWRSTRTGNVLLKRSLSTARSEAEVKTGIFFEG